MSTQLKLEDLRDGSYPSFAVDSKEQSAMLLPKYGEALEQYNQLKKGGNTEVRIRIVMVNESASSVTEVGTLCEHNEGIE